MCRRSGGGGGVSTSVSSLTGMVPMLVPNPSQDRPVRIGDTEADQVERARTEKQKKIFRKPK